MCFAPSFPKARRFSAEKNKEVKQNVKSISISTDKAVALLEAKKYSSLRIILNAMEPADIAEFMEEVPKEQHPVVFRILPKELAADVFVEMDPDQQELLISGFSDSELREVLDEMYLDDTVDIIEEMPANVIERILKNSTPDMRKVINEVLKYPKNSAGSIMTTEYVSLKEDMTVAQAFEIIRKVAIDKETIYTCYVTDAKRCLLGLISAKTLLISPLDAVIGDIMDSNFVYVSTLDDQEDVAKAIEKYDLLAIPVVDNEQRLLGIVTVDDAIDVMQNEAEEDFAVMAAVTPTEKPYLKTSPFELWKARIPWLLLLMISATFTGMIISSFEDALAVIPALTAFIPMLMDTGGNSGSQASVTVIRGISLGEIEFRDIGKVIWKELRTALFCAVTLAVVNFGKIILVDGYLLNNPAITGNLMIPLAICVTLAVTVIAAKMIGCILPILAKKLGFDPAVMASPFITTLVDAVSLLVYFQIAKILLHC